MPRHIQILCMVVIIQPCQVSMISNTARITLGTLLTWRPLWPLRALRALWPFRALRALWALWTLWPFGTLGSLLALGSHKLPICRRRLRAIIVSDSYIGRAFMLHHIINNILSERIPLTPPYERHTISTSRSLGTRLALRAWWPFGALWALIPSIALRPLWPFGTLRSLRPFRTL